jgi:hypothetical protein
VVCAGHGPTREGEHQEKDPIEKDADLVQGPGNSNVVDTSDSETTAVESRMNVAHKNDEADDCQNEWCDRNQYPTG